MKKNIILIIILLVFTNYNKKEMKLFFGSKKVPVQINESSTNQMLMLFENSADNLTPIKINRTLEQYKKNVHLFEEKMKLNKSIVSDDIESVIPVNMKEFVYFIELTYSDDKGQILFDKINLKIFKFARENRGNTFFLCLNMAEFVDGAYAESYHSDIEDVVMNNKKKFCNVYNNLSKESKRIIDPLYKEVCKGVKRKDKDY